MTFEQLSAIMQDVATMPEEVRDAVADTMTLTGPQRAEGLLQLKAHLASQAGGEKHVRKLEEMQAKAEIAESQFGAKTQAAQATLGQRHAQTLEAKTVSADLGERTARLKAKMQERAARLDKVREVRLASAQQMGERLKAGVTDTKTFTTRLKSLAKVDALGKAQAADLRDRYNPPAIKPRGGSYSVPRETSMILAREKVPVLHVEPSKLVKPAAPAAKGKILSGRNVAGGIGAIVALSLLPQLFGKKTGEESGPNIQEQLFALQMQEAQQKSANREGIMQSRQIGDLAKLATMMKTLQDLAAVQQQPQTSIGSLY